MKKMRATVFHGVNDIRVEEVERPRAGVGEAVIRVKLTTNCREADVVAEVQKLTGRGADVAIEALGTQETFESARRMRSSESVREASSR